MNLKGLDARNSLTAIRSYDNYFLLLLICIVSEQAAPVLQQNRD